jgi:hypothetical protein
MFGFDTLASFFSALWDWIVSKVHDPVNSMLQPIADKMPDLSFETGALVAYASYVNEWIPLGYIITLVSLYYTVVLVFIAVKFVLKLLPWVG